MVDKAENIKVYIVYRAFYLYDVLTAHLAATGVFDDGYTAVELVEVQVLIYIHALAGLDVVEHEAFFYSSYI